MSVVAIIRCESYDYDEVYESIRKGIEFLGGIQRFALPGEKVLLKPNILAGVTPERCVTTHPAVFRAVSEIFKASGAKISYGDNPGVVSLFSAAKKAGISEVAKELKIDTADFKSYEKVYFKEGIQNKLFKIAKAVFDNDGFISIPKFKTHSLTRITGCVKNQFGCLPFLQKRILHAKLLDPGYFAKMLLDLNQCINPRLYIMDSIYAMEGDGPISGKPRKINVLGFSEDPIALDATMCRIISLNPLLVPTILYGHQSGFGEYEEEKIEILGDDINKLVDKNFDVERNGIPDHMQRSLSGKVMHSLIKRPVLIEDNCVKCGNCILACPVTPKAIKFKNKNNDAPEIDYGLCIRCYCCHEICSEKAIKLKTDLL